MTRFHDYLRARLEAGGFSTEDALGSFLPLAREVLEAHAAGRVAPLEGLDALSVDGVRVWFEEARRKEPRSNPAALRRVEAAGPLAVTVVAEARRTTEVDDGDGQMIDLSIGDRSAEITRPVFLPGYVAWEHQVGHHDPLTDVFSLGMILASLVRIQFHPRLLVCRRISEEPNHFTPLVRALDRHIRPFPGANPNDCQENASIRSNMARSPSRSTANPGNTTSPSTAPPISSTGVG